jgi:DNA-binding NarL/FixJ family response regulator
MWLEQNGHNVVATCNNGIEACNQIIARQPAIALLDLSMPGMNGIEILEKLQGRNLYTQTVLLTMQNEYSIYNRAVALGAKGYLLKEFAVEEIEICLQEVLAGRTYFSAHLQDRLILNNEEEHGAALGSLTFAERKILELVAQQQSTREIAKSLFISEKTVESHRSHIIRKLNIPSGKNALLMWAMKNIK